jgi:hypothetical protein
LAWPVSFFSIKEQKTGDDVMKKLIFALMLVSQFAFAAGQDDSDARLAQLNSDLKFSTVQNAATGFKGITSCIIETSEAMLPADATKLHTGNEVSGLIVYITDVNTQKKMTV